MVNSPQYVLWNDEVVKVYRQEGGILWLENGFIYGWTDPRGGNQIKEPYRIKVLLTDCTPITPEVADIMRSV